MPEYHNELMALLYALDGLFDGVYGELAYRLPQWAKHRLDRVDLAAQAMNAKLGVLPRNGIAE